MQMVRIMQLYTGLNWQRNIGRRFTVLRVHPAVVLSVGARSTTVYLINAILGALSASQKTNHYQERLTSENCRAFFIFSPENLELLERYRTFAPYSWDKRAGCTAPWWGRSHSPRCLKASYSKVRVTPPDVTTFPKQHKEEPLFYAAQLMSFGSIQLRLQGNVAIPDAKIRFSTTFAIVIAVFPVTFNLFNVFSQWRYM